MVASDCSVIRDTMTKHKGRANNSVENAFIERIQQAIAESIQCNANTFANVSWKSLTAVCEGSLRPKFISLLPNCSHNGVILYQTIYQQLGTRFTAEKWKLRKKWLRCSNRGWTIGSFFERESFTKKDDLIILIDKHFIGNLRSEKNNHRRFDFHLCLFLL